MNLTYLVGFSTALLAGYFTHLYLIEQKQFYPSCVQILRNRKSLALVFITGNIYAMAMYRICLRLMFGQFRSIELDYLNQRQWSFFRELAFVFSHFQPLFTANTYIRFIFLYYFTLTQFSLSFRIGLINQTFNIQKSRLLLAVLLMLFIDIILVISNLNINRSTINVLFLSRYVLCFIMLMKCLFDYGLNLIDNIYFNNDWPRKSIYNEIINLLIAAINTLIYLVTWCMMVLFGHRSISFFYYAVNSAERFFLIGHNLIRSYQTWARMQEFNRPNANELDSQEFCPICLEPMLQLANVLKAINCRHIYHYECLQRWILRQQYCPICRTAF